MTTEKEAIVAFIVCMVTFFVNNQVIAPDIMESRNIITAREMVYEGHWIVPTMNGELRLEKPPLPTWLTAAAEVVAPDSLALQRGMAGLAALLLVFYFWRFSRRVLHLEPLVPTLLLCTCYSVILMGRTASWDIYCHAFMMGAIYHLARGLGAPPCAWRQFVAAGIYIGLSILSKGPVSLYALLLPFLIVYARYFRPSLRGKGLALVSMVVVALVLGLWWYVCVHVLQGDALSAVVQKESGSWVSHNVRPWWYYWKFFLEAGAWSLLLLTAIFLPLADKERRCSRQWLFSLCWMLASLILLSLLPEKKSRYLLPLLIPASYVMGCLIVWWRKSLSVAAAAPCADKWFFRINAGAMAAVVAGLPVAAWIFMYRQGYVSFFCWLVIALCSCAIALYIVRAAVRCRPMGLLGAVTVLFLTAECFVMPLLKPVINNADMRSIALTREMRELEGVPFYHLADEPLRIELVYAAHRHIRPLDVTCPDSLMATLPCALLTHAPIGEVLPANCLEKVDTFGIGLFDDNRRPKGNRRYSDDFIYHVTLIKEKQNITISQ